MEINHNIARTVGLWLAEGDNKCTNEITFTNNCFELIEFFDRNMERNFRKDIGNKRLYVYSCDGDKIIISSIKGRYLKILKKNIMTTTQLSKHFCVTKRAAEKRLRELENLNLIFRREDKTWTINPQDQKLRIMRS